MDDVLVDLYKKRHMSITGEKLLDFNPYVVDGVSTDNFEEIIEWVLEYMPGENRVIVCWNNYYFKNDIDAVAFKLRWL